MGYDNLRLEKGMYRQGGMSFTQVLESLDPSENYRGTALEGTDAFQRQLKRFGIRAKGAGSSPVEKFFATMDSAVLFPEYIARTVRQGMEENDILPSIVATTTVIDGLDYRSIYSVPSDEDTELIDVEEGANIPTTEITEADLTDGSVGIIKLLVLAGLCASNGEARRNIQQGGVTANDEKVTSIDVSFTAEQLKEGVVVKRGKKNFNKVILK